MTKINLKSKVRDVMGRKVKKFREEGLIPAVMYGHKVKPQNLWVNYLDFKKVYQKAGENTVVELDLDNDKKCNVIIHEIQTDPLSQKFSHIDFSKIDFSEYINATKAAMDNKMQVIQNKLTQQNDSSIKEKTQ